MSADAHILIGGFIALAGVVVGSFLNALVWRLRKRISIGGKERSQCPNCSHKLAWYDLIPVVSWLALKARCRYCESKISTQYPLVEIANGGLWLLSFWILNPSNLIEFSIMAVWFVTISIMLALSVYDIRWMELPDRLVAAFTVTAAFIAALSFDLAAGELYQYLDPLLGVLFIAGLFYLLFQVSDGKWIGGGDVKLAVGIGLLLGLQGSLMALFIASLFGSIFGVVAIALFKHDRKELIPFGPFLLGSTVVVFLFSDQILSWYLYTLI